MVSYSSALVSCSATVLHHWDSSLDKGGGGGETITEQLKLANYPVSQSRAVRISGLFGGPHVL